MSIVNIKITDEMKVRAKAKAKKLSHSYNSYLGEEIFNEFIKPQGKHVLYSDFFVSYPGRHGYILRFQDGSEHNFGTATYEGKECWRLMIADKDWNEPWDFYIGIKLISDVEAQIWGFIAKHNLIFDAYGFNGKRKPTHWAWLKDLVSIQDLIKVLADKPKQEEYYVG